MPWVLTGETDPETGGALWADGPARAVVLTGFPANWTWTVPVAAVTVGVRGGEALPASVLTVDRDPLAAEAWEWSGVTATPGETWDITIGGGGESGPFDSVPLVGGANGGGSGATLDDIDGSWFGCGGGGATTIEAPGGMITVAGGRGGYAGLGNVAAPEQIQEPSDETWPTVPAGTPGSSLTGDSTTRTGGYVFLGAEGVPAGGGGGGWPGGATGPTTKPWGPGANGTTLLPATGPVDTPNGPTPWTDGWASVVMFAWFTAPTGWSIDCIEF